MLVEIACESYVMAARLKACDKLDQIMTEVVAWVCVLPFLSGKGRCLLMECSDALGIRWFLAHLVGSDIRDDFVVMALEM